MIDSGAPTEPNGKKDYWSPSARAARRERRKAREREAEAFALLFVKHGRVSAAARELWPHLPPAKAGNRARTLTRTRTYQEVTLRRSQEIEAETGISIQWVVQRLRILAETAPRASDRIAALRILAQHLGMFVERKEVRSLSVEVQSMPTEELKKLLARELGPLLPPPPPLPDQPPGEGLP